MKVQTKKQDVNQRPGGDGDPDPERKERVLSRFVYLDNVYA